MWSRNGICEIREDWMTCPSMRYERQSKRNWMKLWVNRWFSIWLKLYGNIWLTVIFRLDNVSSVCMAFKTATNLPKQFAITICTATVWLGIWLRRIKTMKRKWKSCPFGNVNLLSHSRWGFFLISIWSSTLKRIFNFGLLAVLPRLSRSNRQWRWAVVAMPGAKRATSCSHFRSYHRIERSTGKNVKFVHASKESRWHYRLGCRGE